MQLGDLIAILDLAKSVLAWKGKKDRSYLRHLLQAFFEEGQKGVLGRFSPRRERVLQVFSSEGNSPEDTLEDLNTLTQQGIIEYSSGTYFLKDHDAPKL